MDKNIFEEGPRRGHAAGDTSIEQQASQLASDIKYKARQKMKGKSGSNMSPGQVQQLYRQLLSSSPAPGGVKAIVKKKLFGEQIDPGIVPVSEHVKESSSYVFSRVFLEADERKFVIRVTDRETGNTSYRKADRAKIAELRANKNISSVEITGRKEVDDAYKGDPKPNYGGKKAKKDYDGDGKVESGSKEYAGVVHNAIQRKKGGVADGQDTRKEEVIYEKEESGEKKLDVMKGKNQIIINPNILENIIEYFYSQGINEDGVNIFVEELGIENFVDFVYDLNEDSELIEAYALTGKKKSPKKLPKGTQPAKTTKKAIARGDSKIRSASPSGAFKKRSVASKAVETVKEKQPEKKPAIAKAAEKAKETQPKKKPVKSTIARGVADTLGRAALAGWQGHKAAMKKKREGGSVVQQIGSGAGKAVGSFFKKGTKHLSDSYYHDSLTISERINAELDALKAQKVEEAAAAAKAAGPTPEERQQLMNKDKMLKKKIMMQKQLIQMQRQGKLPLNYNESLGEMRYCPKCDKDETRDECKYGGEYWDENSKPAKAEDPRSIPTAMNLTKNKLRAMGLKMSYDMEGDQIDERTRYAKETGKDPQTGRPSVKGGQKPDPAFAKVSAELRKTGGMMSSRKQPIQSQGKKKVPGAKGTKGVTPVDRIRGKLAQKRAPKPDIGSRFD
jgi:hypothetical protein